MVTRTLGLALMLAVVPASALAQSGRADVENAFPTFGVALTGPSGWVHLPGGSAGVITRWGKVNPQTGEVVAAVMVEVEPIDAEVGNQYAKRLAQRIAGTVEPGTVDLGGVKAIRVTAGAAGGNGVHPGVAIIAKRGKFAYVLSTFESSRNSASDAVESVRSAWKWLKVEPVTRHLQDLSPPFPAFGRFSLSVPAMARPFEVKNPSGQMHLGIFDYVSSKPVMDIELVVLTPTGDTSKMKEIISETLMRQAGLTQSLTWSDRGGKPRRWLSSSFERKSPPERRGEAPVETVARYALVEVGEREAALMTLQYVIGSPSDRPAFEAANEAIVKSIRPAEGGTAETGSGSPVPPPAGPRGDGSIQITRKPPKAPKPAQP